MSRRSMVGASTHFEAPQKCCTQRSLEVGAVACSAFPEQPKAAKTLHHLEQMWSPPVDGL